MLNRKPFLLILFTLLILFILPSSDVYANDIDIINDPGTTGLWHEIDNSHDKYRAYVYMRWYYSSTPNLMKQNNKDDHTHINPSLIPHSISLGILPRFDNPNNDFRDNYITERAISAPNGFETLFIQSISAKDGSIKNEYVGNTKDIIISLIASYDIGSPTKNDLIVWNARNNQIIYEHKQNDGNFIIYWVGDNIDPPSDHDVIDVKDNYSNLPLLNKQFIKIKKYELLDLNSNSYKLFFENNLKLYSFDISLPKEINIKDFEISKDNLNISYSTFKDKRFLYMQPDKTKNPYPMKYGTVDKPSDLFVGFITIYLEKDNDGNLKYDIIKNLQLYYVINKENMANAYAYLMFDIPIEDIINIHLNFKYRYKYFGIAGSWQYINHVYAKKDTTEGSPLWWMYFSPLTALVGTVFDYAGLLDNQTIKKVSYSTLPDKVITRYINNLEIDSEILKGSTHYRIALGQFSTFGSTNYDIVADEDKFISEITYKYEGVIYEVPYEIIDQNGDNPDISKDLFEFDFKGFFKFEGVNDFGTFLSHLFKYWKETIAFTIFLFLFFIIISFIFKTYSLFKYSFRHKGGYYR